MAADEGGYSESTIEASIEGRGQDANICGIKGKDRRTMCVFLDVFSGAIS